MLGTETKSILLVTDNVSLICLFGPDTMANLHSQVLPSRDDVVFSVIIFLEIHVSLGGNVVWDYGEGTTCRSIS